jgi:uncharacterized glyoxalase superfamily protein PhnB
VTSIHPVLTARAASAAVDFYKRALGADELSRATNPNGIVAEMAAPRTRSATTG